MEKIKYLLREASIKRVLDVASGKGEFIHVINHLLEDNIDIYALDKNQKIVNHLAQTFGNIHPLSGDALDLPFCDISFDLVCLSNSLHHFPQPIEVIIELKRVVKPEGYILIQEMVCDSDQSAAQKCHIEIHHFCAEIDMLRGEYHQPTWSSPKLINFVKENFSRIIYLSDHNYELENVFDQQIIYRYENAINNYLKLIKQKREYRDLKRRSDLLIKKLNSNGFSPAREWIFLLKS